MVVAVVVETVVVVLRVVGMTEVVCSWMTFASAIVVIARIVDIADLCLVAVPLFNPPDNITQNTLN